MIVKRFVMPLIILILLGFILYFNYQNYKLGSREEREDLLVAVMFDLTNNRAVTTKEDIKKIEFFRSHAGVYPYFYTFVVTLENGKEFTYSWANKEKESLHVSVYPTPSD